ncbi:hypothetical protein BDR05DRAFT_74851 [Suillus weaverae]|nr:hypothetical protein BDR05DRAFT_74851 [Suillus weaverae]
MGLSSYITIPAFLALVSLVIATMCCARGTVSTSTHSLSRLDLLTSWAMATHNENMCASGCPSQISTQATSDHVDMAGGFWWNIKNSLILANSSLIPLT